MGRRRCLSEGVFSPGKRFPGFPRRCPLRWSPHLPVLSTAALLLALSLRPESTASASEGGRLRLPRHVQRELDRRLDSLAELARALSAEPIEARERAGLLPGPDPKGSALLSLTIERLDGAAEPGWGPPPPALQAGDPAFDRVHRDGRSFRGAPYFDPHRRCWSVTLTAPLPVGANSAALLRAEIDLSALLARRAR